MKQIIFIFMAILLATGIASAQNKAVISADETSSISERSRKRTAMCRTLLK